ncbi:MAG TPA: energy-coupled thiamine transporter ThiT [Bacilli bacterium]|nr:energy-coupled thiamine transporter ThiT [Bacilli bacterium]
MTKDIKAITETAILVALGIVLQIISNLVAIFQMPQGGSVSFAYLPILAIGLRRGLKYGFLGGLIFAFSHWLLDGYVLHFGSIFFDYLFVGLAFGLTGFFHQKRTNTFWFLLALFLGGFVKYIMHSLSGVMFFANNTPADQTIFIYSFIIYNLPYNAISTVLAMVLGLSMKTIITDVH